MNPTPPFLYSMLFQFLSRRQIACLIIGVTSLCCFDVSLAAAVPPVLLPFAPDSNGIVSGEISHQLEYTGMATSFSVTGLPNGVKLNPTTGWITGRPLVAGNYTIVFTASNAGAKSAPLTIPWTVEPLPEGTAGTFHALLDRHPWYNGGYGGSLQITVTATGTYTGYITRGIHRTQIKGVLDTVPGGSTAPESSFLVARRAPYEPLTVAFSLPIGSGSIIGTLREPEGDVIQLSGYRAAFSKTNPATAYVGQWNTALELPNELIGDSTYPQGAGWAIQTISSTGSVAWISKLADGTPKTFSTALGAQGQTAVHLMLYDNAGSLQGTVSFDSNSDTTSGSLGWVKSPVYSRNYSAGFPLHFLNASGALYTPPAANELIFGITAGADNARLLFTQGGLSSPFTQTFTIGTGNVITLPALGSVANPYKIKLTATLKTGVVSGSGTAMDYSLNQPANARLGIFSSLLIPGREQAVGYFLLPTSTSNSAPLLSGKLIGEENAPLNN
jgi:hypothetical protein